MVKKLIIAITGTQGAGKGTIVEYLQERYGFEHYSASGFISEEIVKRGLEVNRDNMRIVGNDLRKQHGSDYVIKTLLEKASISDRSVIIESIRALGEVELLKKNTHAILLAVDADQRLRYERITNRGSAKDHVTFEHFREQEKLEANSNNPHEMNIIGCVAQADYVIMNDKDMDALYKYTDAFVDQFLSE